MTPDASCTVLCCKDDTTAESAKIDAGTPDRRPLESISTNIMFKDGTKIINPTVGPHNDIDASASPGARIYVNRTLSLRLVPTNEMTYSLNETKEASDAVLATHSQRRVLYNRRLSTKRSGVGKTNRICRRNKYFCDAQKLLRCDPD